MKILKQLLIIFILCLLGQWIANVLPIIIPGSVVSMVLLLILLMTGIIKIEHIKETTEFLLTNLAFFFAPLTVGIIENFDLIKDSIWSILFICIFTTFITFATTAFTVVWVIKIMDKRRRRTYDGNN